MPCAGDLAAPALAAVVESVTTTKSSAAAAVSGIMDYHTLQQVSKVMLQLQCWTPWAAIHPLFLALYSRHVNAEQILSLVTCTGGLATPALAAVAGSVATAVGGDVAAATAVRDSMGSNSVVRLLHCTAGMFMQNTVLLLVQVV